MYSAAIKVLKDEVETMSRVCGLYQFSRYPQNVKVAYIAKINELDEAIAALEIIEGANLLPPTSAGPQSETAPVR